MDMEFRSLYFVRFFICFAMNGAFCGAKIHLPNVN